MEEELPALSVGSCNARSLLVIGFNDLTVLVNDSDASHSSVLMIRLVATSRYLHINLASRFYHIEQNG